MPGEPRFGQNLEPMVVIVVVAVGVAASDRLSVMDRLEAAGISESETDGSLDTDRGQGEGPLALVLVLVLVLRVTMDFGSRSMALGRTDREPDGLAGCVLTLETADQPLNSRIGPTSVFRWFLVCIGTNGEVCRA